MDSFTQAYVDCALWSSSQYDENGENEIRLDEHDGEISPQTLNKMETDCEDFQEANAELLSRWYELGGTEERAGHDFWLTRNGHGAGFWDRYYGDQEGTKIGKQLSDAAKVYGSIDLYIGDDNFIYST
jgi:hypothetical protein